MDKYGVIARLELTVGWQTLYTCPDAAETTYDSGNISVSPKALSNPHSALISSIVVCRLAASGGAAKWFSLAVVSASGDAVANQDYIAYQQQVNGGSTKVISLGMTLKAGQTLKAQAEADNSVNVIVNGVEIF